MMSLIFGYLLEIGVHFNYMLTCCKISIYGDNSTVSYSEPLEECGFSIGDFTAYCLRCGVPVKCKLTLSLADMRFLSTGWCDFFGSYYAFNEHYDKLVLSCHMTKFKVGVRDKHANKLICISRLLLFGEKVHFERVQHAIRLFLEKFASDGPQPWTMHLRMRAYVDQHDQRLLAAGRQTGCIKNFAGLKIYQVEMPKKAKQNRGMVWGPLTKEQAARKEQSMRDKAVAAEMKRLGGAVAAMTVQPKKKVKQQVARGLPDVFTRVDSRKGPAAVGVSAVAGPWPRTYVGEPQRRGNESNQIAAFKFCAPFAYLGASSSASVGSGALCADTSLYVRQHAISAGSYATVKVVADEKGTGPTDNEYDHTPWLGNQLIQFANMYGKYRFRGKLRIHYVPLNATTASARSYFIAFSPDPSPAAAVSDEDPWTMTNMLNMANFQALAAWQPTTMEVIVSPNEDKWYFLPDSASSTAAPSEWTRQVDQFSIGAVTNFASSANLIDGLLFLEGEVEFCNWIGTLRQATALRRPNVIAPTGESGRDPTSQGEMKTRVPATIRDLRVPLLPGMSPPSVASLMQLDDRTLQQFALALLQERDRRSGSESVTGPRAQARGTDSEFVSVPPNVVDDHM